jgi:hypothetical protein
MQTQITQSFFAQGSKNCKRDFARPRRRPALKYRCQSMERKIAGGSQCGFQDWLRDQRPVGLAEVYEQAQADFFAFH